MGKYIISWYISLQNIIIGCDVARIIIQLCIHFSMISDTNLFVDNTVAEVDYFANQSLNELLTYFDDELENAGVIIEEVVNETLTLIQFDDIQNITNFVLDISNDFMENEKDLAIELLSNLENDTSNLGDRLNDIQIVLAKILVDSGCQAVPECQEAVTDVEDITSDILNKLTTYTIIEEAKSSIEGITIDVEEIQKLVSLTNTAEEALRNFSVAFVNDYTKVIRENVDNITVDIRNEVASLTSELRNIDLNNTEAVQEIDNKLAELSGYTDTVLYVSLVPAIVLGVALLLSCFGLIVGNYEVIYCHAVR